MLANMKKFLESGRYSDLTLVCNDNRFHVHKLVLDASSPVFEKILAGAFKEGQENTTKIELEDDVEALQAMIHYMYESTYTDKFTSESKKVFAVKVYSIADKYEISALQDLAAKKLKSLFEPAEDGEQTEFIDTIKLVDERTNPKDNTLWDIVLPVIQKNMSKLLQGDAFKDLLYDNFDLTIRLLSMVDSKNSLADLDSPDSPINETGGMDSRPYATNFQNFRRMVGR